MSVDAGSASVYGTKRLKIVTKDPASVPFQIDLQFGWSYRRALTIPNTGSALTDYQVSFIVDTAALITAGKMQSLGHDIRVTDSDETTMFPFWVDSINTTTTKIWVKIPSIPNGTKTIYLYYGNPNAVDTQSGANTFIQWHGAASTNFKDANVIAIPFIFEASARRTAAGSQILFGVASTAALLNGINSVNIFSHDGAPWTYGLSYKASLEGYVRTSTPWTINTYYKLKIVASASNSVYYEAPASILSDTITDPNRIPDSLLGLGLQIVAGSGDQEWSFIRKYAATEPTTEVGAETVPTTGIGSAIQTIFKVAESSGNVGIRNSSPTNILTIQQNSLTDPIADSWTTWPCDRTTKIILRELTGPEALPELAKIRLYEWKKKPRRVDISMPKFNAARIGMMIDDPEVPARILVYDTNGKLQGIDLLAYCGFLHVALKELSVKVAALEAKPPL